MHNQLEYIKAIEQSLLSSILFNNTLFDILREKNLTLQSFTFKHHKEIYINMADAYSKGLTINENELIMYNKEHDNTLIDIVSTNPISNPVHYVKILNDFRFKENTLNNLNKIISKSSEQSGAEIYNEVVKYIDKGMGNLRSTSLIPLHDIKDEKLEILLEDYLPIPTETVTNIVAKGDTGKTFLMLNAALIYMLKQIKDKTYKKCFCWFSEDSSYIIKKRRDDILVDYFSPEDAKLLLDPRYKHLLQINQALPFYILNETKFRTFEPSDDFLYLKNDLKSFNLVILDPLASFIGSNENDNSMGKASMNALVHWAKEDKKAIAVIHHTPHETRKARGGEAIRDTSKLQYFVEKIKDKEGNELDSNSLKIIVDKDNYGIFKNKKKNFRLRVFPKNKEGRLT